MCTWTNCNENWNNKRDSGEGGGEKIWLSFAWTHNLTPWNSLFWEDNNFPACKEIPPILWKLKVQYCVHKCLPLAHILSHTSSQLISLKSTSVFAYHVCVGLQTELFPSGFLTKTCMHLSSPPYIPLVPTTLFFISSPK